MSNFNELNKKSKQIYDSLGFSSESYICGGQILNLFKMLKIAPEIGDNGERKLTPYELLGVAPVFDKRGEERPIVFAIKNRANKVTKNLGIGCGFIYQANKVKNDKNLLESMLENYKKAVLYGNESDAEMYYKMLDDISGGKAREILDSFFDYSKFYRRMKRQLLIDIFAHFFLMYVTSKKSIIKNGLLKKNKIYKAYHEEYEETVSDTFEFDMQNLNFAGDVVDAPMLQSIKITQSNDYEIPKETEPAFSSKQETGEIKISEQKKEKPKKDLTRSVIKRPKKIKIRRFKQVVIDNTMDKKNSIEKNKKARVDKALANV